MAKKGLRSFNNFLCFCRYVKIPNDIGIAIITRRLMKAPVLGFSSSTTF